MGNEHVHSHQGARRSHAGVHAHLPIHGHADKRTQGHHMGAIKVEWGDQDQPGGRGAHGQAGSAHPAEGQDWSSHDRKGMGHEECVKNEFSNPTKVQIGQDR